MNELLQALTTADKICKQANTHYVKAAQLEQQGNTLAESMKKAKTKWIIVGVVIWAIGSFIGRVFVGIPVVGMVISAVFSIGSIYLGYRVGSTRYKKEQESVNSEIAKLQAQIEKEKGYAQQIFDDHVEELAFLPVDYWYPMATEYLMKVIQAKRANTLGEAIDKFEEQLHRWKIEEANAQMVAQQQQQTAHLASIKTSSKISAAANVTNTIFNIASRI